MLWMRYGALVMFAAVVFGAFGGHALRDRLSADAQRVYHVGILYHLVHGLALLAVGWMATLKPNEPLLRTSGWLFVAGILLFSDSLYLLAAPA